MTHEVLTTSQMAQADRLTIAGGLSGFALMLEAGRSVARIILRDWTMRPVLVLCGPGNNGGDGFVIAEELRLAGWPVFVAASLPKETYQGDAAKAARYWQGEMAALGEAQIYQAELIVDALFGAGLTRPIEGLLADLIHQVNDSGLPVIAVDMPSGICGNSGLEKGAGVQAHSTVTFFRKKPGHLLYPGRSYCGQLHVTQIGIADKALEDIRPQTFENSPAWWMAQINWPGETTHKFQRGSALVFAGGVTTGGAARLSARGCLRSGAGLVTLVCPRSALFTNAAHLDEIMLESCDEAEEIEAMAERRKMTAALIGPAAGYGAATRTKALALLGQSFPVVLDADALTSFEDDVDELLQELTAEDVLTPHEGEFKRLFPDALTLGESRLEAAKLAAKTAGSVIVLKGADTVIAAPDGRAAINSNGTPWLATAGSGDVLAGITTGLLAQGMPAFEAAAMAVWLHAEAGHHAGPGLIAGDLIESLPVILRGLYERALSKQ